MKTLIALLRFCRPPASKLAISAALGAIAVLAGRRPDGDRRVPDQPRGRTSARPVAHRRRRRRAGVVSASRSLGTSNGSCRTIWRSARWRARELPEARTAGPGERPGIPTGRPARGWSATWTRCSTSSSGVGPAIVAVVSGPSRSRSSRRSSRWPAPCSPWACWWAAACSRPPPRRGRARAIAPRSPRAELTAELVEVFRGRSWSRWGPRRTPSIASASWTWRWVG